MENKYSWYLIRINSTKPTTEWSYVQGGLQGSLESVSGSGKVIKNALQAQKRKCETRNKQTNKRTNTSSNKCDHTKKLAARMLLENRNTINTKAKFITTSFLNALFLSLIWLKGGKKTVHVFGVSAETLWQLMERTQHPPKRAYRNRKAAPDRCRATFSIANALKW